MLVGTQLQVSAHLHVFNTTATQCYFIGRGRGEAVPWLQLFSISPCFIFIFCLLGFLSFLNSDVLFSNVPSSRTSSMCNCICSTCMQQQVTLAGRNKGCGGWGAGCLAGLVCGLLLTFSLLFFYFLFFCIYFCVLVLCIFLNSGVMDFLYKKTTPPGCTHVGSMQLHVLRPCTIAPPPFVCNLTHFFFFKKLCHWLYTTLQHLHLEDFIYVKLNQHPVT